MKHLSYALCLLVLFTSCKKGSGPGGSGGDFKQFLVKSQWVGVLDKNGYQYAPPASLQFRSESKLVIYAPFYLIQGGVWTSRDSLQGDITKMEELTDGKTITVTTQLEHFGEVVLTITDRKSVNVNAPDPTNASRPLIFAMEVYEGNFSVEGTQWSGPVMTGGGPMQGLPAYPDLSTVGFSNNTTYYYRNGAIIMEQPTPQIPTPGELRVLYKQIGNVVFMSGYNETNHSITGYMGVLLPGNNKMMVFSGDGNSRLPNYLQTIAWYGPIGQTPIIEKK